MPVFDCTGEMILRGDIQDRIEADTAEEADRKLIERAKAGRYDDQVQIDPDRTVRPWDAQEDS